MIHILDGRGSGTLAEVDKRHQLRVRSESEPVQHTQGLLGNTYQVKSVMTLASGIIVPIILQNASNKENIVITYIRHQLIGAAGGTAFPNDSNYFSMGLGQKYSSGGDVLTPVNLNTGSGIEADVLAWGNNPTLKATYNEIDRWYTKENGDMNTFNKQGSIVVTPNQALQLKYIGDKTSGIIYTRISFYMKEID